MVVYEIHFVVECVSVRKALKRKRMIESTIVLFRVATCSKTMSDFP